MKRQLGLALAAAVGAGALVAAAPAQAVDRPYVLTEGHIDLFDVIYDESVGGLLLQVGDDTSLYDQSKVFREPEDVTIAVDAEAAALEVPELPEACDCAFVGEPGDVVYQLPMSEEPGLPWPGWSTERLASTLPEGVELPAAGSPIEVELEITGPGDTHLYMWNSVGAVINHYVDTTDGAADVIPMSRNQHAHAEWLFTEQGSYTVTATPRATATSGAELNGPSAEYHFQVGAASTVVATSTTAALSRSTQPYGARGPATVTVQVATDAGGVAEGTVGLSAGGRKVADPVFLDQDGTATLTLPRRLVPGLHQIVAAFEPADPAVQARSTAEPVPLRVTKAATTTRIRTKQTLLRAGQRARIAVVVSASLPPAGKVVVRDGRRRLTTVRLDRRGKATLRLPRLRPGRHRLSATYTGNSRFATSTGRQTIRVTR